MKERVGTPDMDLEILFRIIHKPGMLGKLLTLIGDHGGSIGDIHTVFIGKHKSVRRITISVYDEEHLDEIRNAMKNFKHAEWIDCNDVVFDRHKGGKIYTKSTTTLNSLKDLRYIYTPGVARVCQAIMKNPSLVYDYTALSNSVGIFTNGTRVLGLGDIGVHASLPVMEGKAVIYDHFVKISAYPILVDTKDPKEFVQIVEKIAPSFGAVHLEDIRMPDCFYIEEELIRRLKVPVMHDDQHGTATVVLAAVMSACRMMKIVDIKSIKIAQIGLGASGHAIATLLLSWGADVYGVDLSQDAQQRFAKAGGKLLDLASAMKSCKIIIASTGIPGLIKKEYIQKDQVILAISNPNPEIDPNVAMEAGAMIASDGKNINNALAYPGLFKGVMEARGSKITDSMKIKTAEIISLTADDNELVPSPFVPDLHLNITKAVKEIALRGKK